MSHSFSLRPLFETHLGYDTLFRHLESLIASGETRNSHNNYPPANIIRNKEDGSYAIELALAGFKKNEIKIELQKRQRLLRISSVLSDEQKTSPWTLHPETYDVVRNKIAKRSFNTAFTISEDLEVTQAKFEDGLLTIILVPIAQDGELLDIAIQ